MSEVVKKAMGKAAEAVMAEMGWVDDGGQDFEPVDTAAHVAAAAISVFLRALHDETDGGVVEFAATMAYTGAFEELAAAVERAGGGA